MKYKHVIWDWNGTLLDDTWLFVEVMNISLAKRGLSLITRDIYRDLFTFPVRDYYIKLGFDLEKEPFEKCGMEFIHEYEKRKFDATLYSQAAGVLINLKDQGISHSILSAQNQKTLDELTAHYQIRNLFMGINGLDDHYAHGKVEVAKAWIRTLNFDPHEVLMVGDTEHDHEVAEAMGIDCLLLSCGHNSVDRLHSTAANVVHSFDDIRLFFEG
jgi:phosphoglycolate phosphatase